MSVINLGLQCVGMMRKEGSTDFEKAIKNANNLKAVCAAVKEKYSNEVSACLLPPQQYNNSITSRLTLKGEPFSLFDSASDEEMEAFFEVLHLVDSSVDISDTSKSALQRMPKMKAFFDHCCQLRHYSFCVKKCGSSDCNICKPLRMDS